MKKLASREKIEQILRELSNIAENCGDDDIRSDLWVVIEDTCKDRDICQTCLGHIDEAYIFDQLVRTCHCGQIPQNRAV